MPDWLFSVFDWIIAQFNKLGTFFINLLPTSPFYFVSANSEFSEILGLINYFVPFTTFISIGQTWLVCVGLYHLYQIGLRWAKAI